MRKKLAIKGHPTRGKEVIELLEMMSGVNSKNLDGKCGVFYFFIDNETSIGCASNFNNNNYAIFTLEEFWEKYPYKVGDVIKFPNNMAEEIAEMKWDEELQDIIYTSVSGWTRPCHVPKNIKNKTDCKKCGLHFGSVRCFAIDCPHNTPKSNAVGLKDGKVVDCITNKKTDMNNNKPVFKAGDVIKPKRCPDEKSNREVTNTKPFKMKNVLSELLKHIKTTPKEELEREFEEIKEWSNVGPTVEEFRTFCKCVNKKPKYPDNYEECVRIAKNIHGYDIHIDVPAYGELMESFVKLLICRDAYWKIAGEQMGLGKPWEPNWTTFEGMPAIFRFRYNIVCDSVKNQHCLLVFPTEEMRNAFYENFKKEIEQCKELL